MTTGSNLSFEDAVRMDDASELARYMEDSGLGDITNGDDGNLSDLADLGVVDTEY